MKRVLLMFGIVAALAACGGGGGSSPPLASENTNIPNQSAGGFWLLNNGAGAALVTESGEFFFMDASAYTSCNEAGYGQLSVHDQTLTGNINIELPSGCSFPDGSVSATGFLSGTVQQQKTLTTIVNETTAAGTVLSGASSSWQFSSVYLQPSAISNTTGNYTNGQYTLTIDGNGIISEQLGNGCQLTGEVFLLNPSYNAFRVWVKYIGCTSVDTSLNDVQFNGLAIIDTSFTPPVLYYGLKGQVNGTPVVQTGSLTRQ